MQPQHYGFVTNEADSDAVFGRIRELGLGTGLIRGTTAPANQLQRWQAGYLFL